jgi:hypothetical protein
MRFNAFAVIMLAVLAGCKDSNGPELSECPGAVAVSVTSGTEPSFSWEPPCRLFFLIVEPADAGTDQWGVITLGINAILPPVKYGVVPPGAEEFQEPTQLEAGRAYKVGVGRYLGGDEDDGEIIGTQEFTP